MSLLLNWRVWVALVLAGGLAFSHLTAYRKGKHDVRLEWTASVASANAEARRLENARQSRVDDVVRLSVARQAGIRADADRVADTVRGLRDALRAADERGAQSAATANQRAAALGELLAAGAEAHRDLAQRCDRHVNDVRTLLEAWPTNKP